MRRNCRDVRCCALAAQLASKLQQATSKQRLLPYMRLLCFALPPSLLYSHPSIDTDFFQPLKMNALFIDLLGYFHTLLFVEIRKFVVFAALISHRNLYNLFFATERFVVIDVANFSAEERQRGGLSVSCAIERLFGCQETDLCGDKRQKCVKFNLKFLLFKFGRGCERGERLDGLKPSMQCTGG